MSAEIKAQASPFELISPARHAAWLPKFLENFIILHGYPRRECLKRANVHLLTHRQ